MPYFSFFHIFVIINSAIIPATVVRASDLSEGMTLSNDNERITLSNIKVNGLGVDFSYLYNGQSKSGKIILDFEIVRLEGLGTGMLFNDEKGKVVMNIMKSSGEIIVFRED